MRYRTFGQTGKSCSVIGFGGMRFGHDNREAVRSVERAIDLGINYFDTAPLYCDDRSEDIIGEAIQGHRDEVYLSTKSGIGQDPKAADVLQRIEGQLRRLRVEHIDFYHMWCIMDLEHFERVVAPGGPLDGARKAKAEGKIGHILLSAHANGQEIEKMIGYPEIEGLTLGYNVMNHTNRYRGMQAAHEAGLGVVVMNPLGGGMIPKAPRRFDYLAGDGQEPVAAAIRFLLYHPEITVVLCGMGSSEDVEYNAPLADEVERPDRSRVENLKNRIESHGEDYCTMCRYCMPCPAGINIPYYVFAVDRHRLNDEEGARKWVEWLRGNGMLGEGRPEDCTECEECLPRCTQKLPIIERLKRAGRIFA